VSVWAPGCPAFGQTVLEASMRVFPEEVSTGISGLNEVYGLTKCGWASSNPPRA
jgi:hypothetical protein